jgi:phenylacetate-coenzyme A ligase PaaK-like adenylate-forming protein
MRLGYDRRRIAWFGTLIKHTKTFAAQERLSAGELARLREERLARLLAHAREHSAFWRRRIPAGAVALDAVPPLDKAEMMARYDELVTDPRLRRDALLGWVESRRCDEFYGGRYRVMTTSGSSGRKGLFVYDRAGWAGVAGQWLRASGWMGVTPAVPRRRLALLSGASVTHMSTQGAASLKVGVHRVLGLAVTAPIEEQVAALNRFQPQFLNAYPSAAMRLAEEQEAGRLRLSLTAVSTSSELRTPAMTERLTAAFGVRPFDLYATTEGLFGAECERHEGIHLFDDASVVENVDEDGRPVPPGTPGARLLVTNLHNLVQPIIRLAVADVMTIDPEPCPCGRALVRVTAVDGRCDDVLSLPARGGGTVSVLPAHFSVITRDRAVREFQVRQEPGGVRILVVPCGEAGAELEPRLRAAVERALSEVGADARVEVERREEIARMSGKHQIVVAADGPLLAQSHRS